METSYYTYYLGIVANYAAIMTALVAFIGYGLFVCERRKKRIKLEEYLKMVYEKDAPMENRTGKRTLIHLMAGVGLTEAEVLHACFSSKCIGRYIESEGSSGKAKRLLFGYIEGRAHHSPDEVGGGAGVRLRKGGG